MSKLRFKFVHTFLFSPVVLTSKRKSAERTEDNRGKTKLNGKGIDGDSSDDDFLFLFRSSKCAKSSRNRVGLNSDSDSELQLPRNRTDEGQTGASATAASRSVHAAEESSSENSNTQRAALREIPPFRIRSCWSRKSQNKDNVEPERPARRLSRPPSVHVESSDSDSDIFFVTGKSTKNVCETVGGERNQSGKGRPAVRSLSRARPSRSLQMSESTSSDIDDAEFEKYLSSLVESDFSRKKKSPTQKKAKPSTSVGVNDDDDLAVLGVPVTVGKRKHSEHEAGNLKLPRIALPKTVIKKSRQQSISKLLGKEKEPSRTQMKTSLPRKNSVTVTSSNPALSNSVVPSTSSVSDVPSPSAFITSIPDEVLVQAVSELETAVSLPAARHPRHRDSKRVRLGNCRRPGLPRSTSTSTSATGESPVCLMLLCSCVMNVASQVQNVCALYNRLVCRKDWLGVPRV